MVKVYGPEARPPSPGSDEDDFLNSIYHPREVIRIGSLSQEIIRSTSEPTSSTGLSNQMISPTDNVDSSISTEAAHSSSSLESRTESLTLETIGDTHENSLITVETARSSFEIQKPDKQLRSIIRDSKLTNREKLKAIKHFVKSNIRYYKRLTASESLISIYFFKNIDYEHTLKHIDHATLYFKENGDEDCLAKVKLIETAIILAQTFQKTCVNTLNKADISKRSAEKFPYTCKRILETKMGGKKKKDQRVFLSRQIIQDLIEKTGKELRDTFNSEN